MGESQNLTIIREHSEDYLSTFLNNSNKEKPDELNNIVLEKNFRFENSEIEKIEICKLIEKSQQLTKEHKKSNPYREFLLNYNYRLVFFVMKKFSWSKCEPDELLNEGVEALLKAIDKFDITRSSAFAVYVYRSITHKLSDWVTKERGIPRKISLAIGKYNKTEEDMKNKLNRDPTFAEIAAVMEITLNELRDILNFKDYISFDNNDDEEEFVSLEKITGEEDKDLDIDRIFVKMQREKLTDHENEIIDFYLTHKNENAYALSVKKFGVPFSVIKVEALLIIGKIKKDVGELNDENDKEGIEKKDLTDANNNHIGFTPREMQEFTRTCEAFFKTKIQYNNISYADINPAEAIKYLKDEVYTMDFGYGIARLFFRNDGEIAKDDYSRDNYLMREIEIVTGINLLCKKNGIGLTCDRIRNLLTSYLGDRDAFFKIAFALSLDHLEVNNFLTLEMGQTTFKLYDIDEAIMLFAFYHKLKYSDYIRLKNKFIESFRTAERAPQDNILTETRVLWENLAKNYKDEETFIDYLLKNRFNFGLHGEKSEFIPGRKASQTAKNVFKELLEATKEKAESLTGEKISVSTLISLIYKIPLNQKAVNAGEHPAMRISASLLHDILSGKLDETRINTLLKGRVINGQNIPVPVEKKDIVTLRFFLFCLELQSGNYANEVVGIRLKRFETNVNMYLIKAGFGHLYVANRFDNLIMTAILHENPHRFFTDVVRKSFE